MHHVRTFLPIDRQAGRSTGILFLDLREAFYRVLRPLALCSSWTDEDLAAIALKLNLSHGALHDLHRNLQEPCAISQARLPGYVQNYIAAIHSDT